MQLLTRQTPRKQKGQGLGPRKVDGLLLDVRSAAAFLGTTEKAMRGMIDRRLIPHRRLASRIILLRSELENFVVNLPGCAPAEAEANLAARHG